MFCDEHYLEVVDSESKTAASNHRISNKFAKFSICYEIHSVEEESAIVNFYQLGKNDYRIFHSLLMKYGKMTEIKE